MATSPAATMPAARSGRALLGLGLRLIGAVLLAGMAAIHVYLYLNGYQSVPTIGLLFLLNGIGGAILTIAVLAAPRRFLGVVALLGALFELGTLAALVASILVPGGLFGFQESTQAFLVPTTLWVESAGVVVLAMLTGVAGFAGLRRA
ncbi:MAG TPA: hypothetical protein VJ914_09485 [Pseudonocardiaceae bacterium]|nr:hypothetical protein [Pseudonocardiaceae bacterium]